MTEKQYVSTNKASQILISEGIISKAVKYPDQSTKRLINQGLLRGNPPPSNQPGLGYQIEVDSINEFIQIGRLNNGELIKLVLDLKAENENLKSTKKETKPQPPRPTQTPKQPPKIDVKVLTLKETLEILESKTAMELSQDLDRGKNFIADKLTGVGFKSKRSHASGELQTLWIWSREDKTPPLDANILEQKFVSENK